MVLGLTRSRTRSSIADLSTFQTTTTSSSHSWHSDRGEILFETPCDVIGGFPGYANVGGRLHGLRLRITERYLLVGDGSPHGFGLPIRQLDGSAFLPMADEEDYALRLFYRDGLMPRLFTLQFQGMRLPSRGGLRAERAQLSLLRAGFHDRYADAPPHPHEYSVSWEETASFEFENVLWRGEAIVPLAVGLDGIPGTVWLTTRSLIWGCETAPGVQRVPLTHVTDLAAEKLADRDETPALYVGIGDESTGHFDLPFIFNQQSTPDSNLRERGALLVGLRSRGLPIGHPTPASQPWRDRSTETFPTLPALNRTATDDGVAVIPPVITADLPAPRPTTLISPIPAIETDDYPEWPELQSDPPSLVWEPDPEDLTDTSGALEPPANVLDIVLAEWSAVPDEQPATPVYDVQLATSWLAPIAEEPAASADETPPQSNATVTEAPPPPSLLRPVALTTPDRTPCADAYVTASESVLTALQTGIHDRAAGNVTPISAQIPSAADQAAALAELTALKESGDITADELRQQSARLLALGDICVRLLSLIDVRDRGIISDDDLSGRHQFLVAQLRASGAEETQSVMRPLRRAG